MPKLCNKCGNTKSLDAFQKCSRNSSGVQSACKECRAAASRTKVNHLKQLYRSQKAGSKKRGHLPPDYSQDEFVYWGLKSIEFHSLYCSWVLADFRKKLSPSCDRVECLDPYTLPNLQWMTWEDNKQAYMEDRKSRVVCTNKGVRQMDLHGNEINTFVSRRSAARALNLDNISICTAIKNSTEYGGFLWQDL